YYAFSAIKYPGVPQLDLEEVEPLKPFHLFDQKITPFEVLHYKMPVLGFRIGQFAYITDAKTVPAESIEVLRGVDVLVVNALQDSPLICRFRFVEAIAFSQQIHP